MTQIRREPVDSEVLGRAVLSLDPPQNRDEFEALERSYCAEHRPVYVTAKVPVHAMETIHLLENAGFRWIECQIRSVLKLGPHLRQHAPLMEKLPYIFERVQDETALAEVLKIAETTFTHDRFSCDPLLGSYWAGQRYVRYVQHSYQASDEAVYRLRNRDSGRTLGFKTHRLADPHTVIFLLGGITPDLKGHGLGALNNHFEFKTLLEQGVQVGYTQISAGNLRIVNMEVGKMGFQAIETYVVLRKTYDESFWLSLSGRPKAATL